MSNSIRAMLMMIVCLGGLAGFAWVISASGGYYFGSTLPIVIGADVALLLTYACYRSVAQKFKSTSGKKSRDANIVSSQGG
jgi:hypothetical protein